MTLRTHILALCCLFILGCGAPIPCGKTPSLITLCDFGVYNFGDPQWFELTRERCEREGLMPPIVVSCHGEVGLTFDKNGKLGFEWVLFFHNPNRVIPTRKVAEVLRSLYPHNTIWINACNPGGFVLDIPHVYFPIGNVHCIPDKYANGLFWHEKIQGYGGVGGVDEFICPVLPRRVRLAGER